MAEDDVPPLEDMSMLLHQVEKLREFKQSSTSCCHGIPIKKTDDLKVVRTEPKKKLTTEATAQPSTEKPEQSVDSVPKTKDPGFAGFKKGFLLGATSSAKNKPVPVACKSEDIPFIKARNPEAQETQFQMPQVQEAMKAQQKLLDKTDWVTDDLLTKISQNKNLMKRLQDPVFMQAVAEFQTDSTKALSKYQQNPAVMEFFKETCGILGDHFTKISDHEDVSKSRESSLKVQEDSPADMKVYSSTNPRQPTSEDEQKMARILSRPDVRSALEDPNVQELIAALRANPLKAQSMIQNASPTFYNNIRTLVDNGLLAIQR